MFYLFLHFTDRVIQLRAQHHKNFQLIVISHDEKFISSLSNLSGKQMFQELYRNSEYVNIRVYIFLFLLLSAQGLHNNYFLLVTSEDTV